MDYKKHLFESELRSFDTIRQVKTHISSKTEATFRFELKGQCPMRRYLTAKK